MQGIKRLALAAGLGVLLAACGGPGPSPGPDGDNGGGDTSTVSVQAPGATAAAYRALGSTASSGYAPLAGGWQTPSDPTSFSFNASGAYDVAIRCGDTVTIYSLTTGDLTALNAGCSPSLSGGSTSFTVDYDATGVTGAAVARLFHKAGASPRTGKSGSFSVSDGLPGTQDLVVVVKDSSMNPIAAKMVTENVSDGGRYSLTLTNTDAISQSGTFPDFSSQVPSGWTGGWSVTAITKNGTVIPQVGIGTPAGGPYYELPGIAERYVFLGGADSSDDSESLLYAANRTSAPASISLPDRITFSVSGVPPTFGALPTPAGLLGYQLRISWNSGSNVVRVWISKGYLGSASSYAFPDLTALSGFSGTLPPSGTQVEALAEVAIANKTLREILDATSAYGVEHLYYGVPDLEFKSASKKTTYTAP